MKGEVIYPYNAVATEASADSMETTGSELTFIPGEPKCHCGPQVRVGPYEGQILSLSSFPQWTQGSPNSSCDYFSFLECTIEIDTLCS